jgi:hypothetical protein
VHARSRARLLSADEPVGSRAPRMRRKRPPPRPSWMLAAVHKAKNEQTNKIEMSLGAS